MKRSEMLRALYRKLKKWENCKIRMKETKELLDFIESKGMLPPNVVVDIGHTSELNPYPIILGEWEPEE